MRNSSPRSSSASGPKRNCGGPKNDFVCWWKPPRTRRFSSRIRPAGPCWNWGAERIKGYRADEIIGEHLSRFYPPESIASGELQRILQVAAREGRFSDEGWRLRKADVTVTVLRGPEDKLVGFSKITRDLTERKRAEEALRQSEERRPCLGSSRGMIERTPGENI